MDTNQLRAMAPSLTGPSSHPFESRRLSSRRRSFLRDASGVGSWRRFRSSLPCRLGSIFPLSLISLAHCCGRCCFVSGSDHWDDRQHKHPLPFRCVRVHQTRIDRTVEPGDHATWVRVWRGGQCILRQSPLLFLAPGSLWPPFAWSMPPSELFGGCEDRLRVSPRRWPQIAPSGSEIGFAVLAAACSIFCTFSGLPCGCGCRMWHPDCSQVRSDNLDELVRVQLRRFR